MTHVLLLHAALTEDDVAAAATAPLARLPYGRRLDLERSDAGGRLETLAGIALVLEGARRLRGRPVSLTELRFPQGGKPSLEHGPHFSVSHSGRRVGVALCETCEVGLDLEHSFGGGEKRRPVAGEIERWTAVEAALKAVGAGLREAGEVQLSEDLSAARLAGTVIHLRPLVLGAGCVASLATLSPAPRLIVEEIPVPWRGGVAGTVD